jgi:hypothetical protein
MTLRQTSITISTFVLLIVISTIFKNVILGGTPQTKLSTAPPLAGTISQSIITPQSNGILPVIGKNFNITSTHYFDNQQWVVVSVSTIPDNNGAVLVLQKLNGSYQVVLGPGTLFSSSDVQSMPASVIDYLTNRGLVSNATFSQ